MRFSRSFALAACVAALCCAAGARGAEPDYSVAAPSRFALRFLAEARLAYLGPAPSWTLRGPAKTPYGGVQSGDHFDDRLRFALNRISFEPSLALPWGILLAAQLDWRADVDVEGDFTNDGWPRLVEAFLRREWGGHDGGWGAQVGAINPVFSLESAGPAWTSPYSLTPSAATSWLWQEGRIVGAQVESWRELELASVSAFAGSGWGPDAAGILLAQRGWVLDDALYGVNSTLPLPAAGRQAKVFNERDGRPAIYGGVAARESSGLLEVAAGYFDNLGNRGTAGVWETRYGVAGVRADLLPGLEILVQGLFGETAVRGKTLASNFWSWYPLLSYRRGAHRVTLRYDDFHVEDEDGGTPTGENGWAVTVAYLFEFRLRHRVAVEWLTAAGNRSGAAARDDDGFQMSYRYRY